VRGRPVYLAGFVIFVAWNVWHSLKTCHNWPFPAPYVAAGVTFTMLSLVGSTSDDMESLTSWIAIGLTLAALVKQGFVDCGPHCSDSGANTTAYTAIAGSSGQQTVLTASSSITGIGGQTLA
jgi:hypothetical protein